MSDPWGLFCRQRVSLKRERRYGHSLTFSVSPTHYCFHVGNFKVLITPSELQKKALGKDTYLPFQMHGFPVGFDYPANATILGQSGVRNNPIKNTISYAIIKACIMGELNEDGSHSFFRFVSKDWGEFLLFFAIFLLTCLVRYERVEFQEE